MSLLSPQPLTTKLTGIVSRIRPTGEMLLVQHYNTQSVEGIVLPQQKNTKFQQGMVIAVDNAHNPMNFKVGNHIIFGNTPAASFVADSKNYSLLKQHDVFAKFD